MSHLWYRLIEGDTTRSFDLHCGDLQVWRFRATIWELENHRFWSCFRPKVVRSPFESRIRLSWICCQVLGITVWCRIGRGGVNLQLLKRRPTGLGCNCELAILVLNILHCWLHQYLETWWVCKVVVLKNTAERGQISRPSVPCSPSTCRMPSKRNSNHWSGSKLPGYLDHLDPKACHISSIPDLGAQWTTWSRSSVNDWLGRFPLFRW